jgi:hypothetical protein
LQTEQCSGFASMRSPLIDILVTPIWRGLGNERCLAAWSVFGWERATALLYESVLQPRPTIPRLQHLGGLRSLVPLQTERVCLDYGLCVQTGMGLSTAKSVLTDLTHKHQQIPNVGAR